MPSRADCGDRRPAAVHGDCHRLGHNPRKGALYRDHRRIPDLGFGGSRFQIGGPAGAFIVLVAAIIERHGYDGLLLATMMAGAMMMALGAFKLGTLIKFIPQPVTIGFTAGIAVIIFASQIKDLLGLSLAGKEPGALLPKLQALGGAISTINPAAFGIAC